MQGILLDDTFKSVFSDDEGQGKDRNEETDLCRVPNMYMMTQPLP